MSAHLAREEKFTLDNGKLPKAYCVSRTLGKNVQSLRIQTTSTRHDRTTTIPPTEPQPQSTSSSPSPSPLPPYHPPTSGILSYLPSPLIPYAELIRLDKPTGTIYLFFPCLFSTLLSASLTTPLTPPPLLLSTSTLFLLGALIMRSCGCTINDLWDRNLDPHVARTRLRPIARGAITPRAALVFTAAQLLAGLGVLVSLPPACFLYGVPSLLLVATYPLAKRVTHYPQVVLGLTFSWGAVMGFPALELDVLSDGGLMLAAGALYMGNVAWTVGYDMIYAWMDVRDDRRAGIKSIALAHEGNTKVVLSGLAVVQVGLLGAAGYAVGLGPVFYALSCGGAAGTLGAMIWRVRLRSVENCWWWFRWGGLFTGGAISAGLLGEYCVRLREERRKQEEDEPEHAAITA
ncbi:MAG: Para-hydroxybenzoate--polyprenyltransferase, mitochondrial precursor (PHB:polyprenyltransferase) [Bogoriella megaspora]|nr:MAG: Para-hydroxybenzoate--polyprenyltransferase, mitochondrial precursor (PHB:polyprenyltransferase) [Bogoriella megaspora]